MLLSMGGGWSQSEDGEEDGEGGERGAPAEELRVEPLQPVPHPGVQVHLLQQPRHAPHRHRVPL